MNLLKITYPLWQGGDNKIYSLGSYLLSYLSNFNNYFNNFDSIKEITIDCNPIVADDNRINLIRNVNQIEVILENTKKQLYQINPDKIITYGGDCLVSQQPIDYLLSKHKEKLCVLWIDAHPDISDSTRVRNAHAMVLKNLMGLNNNETSAFVSNYLNPQQIIYCGLNIDDANDYEKEFITNNNMFNITLDDIKNNINILNEYINQNNFEYVYIHLDLDVLSPNIFYSQYYTYNESNTKDTSMVAKSNLTFKHLVTVFKELKNSVDIVGYSIAEYMPWDAYNLIKFFNNINNLL